MWNFFFFCEWRIEIFEQHFHLQISIFFFPGVTGRAISSPGRLDGRHLDSNLTGSHISWFC